MDTELRMCEQSWPQQKFPWKRSRPQEDPNRCQGAPATPVSFQGSPQSTKRPDNAAGSRRDDPGIGFRHRKLRSTSHVRFRHRKIVPYWPMPLAAFNLERPRRPRRGVNKKSNCGICIPPGIYENRVFYGWDLLFPELKLYY